MKGLVGGPSVGGGPGARAPCPPSQIRPCTKSRRHANSHCNNVNQKALIFSAYFREGGMSPLSPFPTPLWVASSLAMSFHLCHLHLFYYIFLRRFFIQNLKLMPPYLFHKSFSALVYFCNHRRTDFTDLWTEHWPNRLTIGTKIDDLEWPLSEIQGRWFLKCRKNGEIQLNNDSNAI